MSENGRGVFHPNVLSLESIKLEDNVPRVQPTPQSIDYEVAPQSNLLQYVDHAGYKTELGSEVEAIGELEKVLEVGRMHVNVLYTFRSVSRAIPMVGDSGDPNKDALHMNTFKVLRPEMEKLTAIMLFYESAVQVFCENVKTLARRGKKQVVPEGLYDALIAVVDLLQKMDYLKDTKACLTNDFSRYKRALTSVRQDIPDADRLGQEQHSLQLFLGNPKHPKQLIINTLRDSVKAISGHLEVLTKMLNLAVERLETNRYMTPDEKYRNVRVVPHLLWLLDGDVGAGGPDGSFNVFKQRKFKLQPLQRICQRYPVVPQCGDMAIRLSYVLERCPHFDPDSSGAWFADAAAAQDYNVLVKWVRMTREFDEYATRLSNALNEIGSGPFAKTPTNVKIAAKVSRMVRIGLRLLQRWACVVLECVAWKHTHPCSPAVFRKAGGDTKGKGMEYERVVRYNWSPNELSALVEVITMTKSLGSLLSRAEGRLAPLLRLHVHASTQQMAQGDLVPILHRADKKKRGIITHLLQLRSMVSDWSDGKAPSEDYKVYKRAQGRVEAKAAPRRVVGPSSTQLQLVRAMVRAIYDENSELRQSTGFLGKEDLKKEDLGLLKTYYEESFGFPYLLDLGGTIRSTTDLGDLWYREYHLELTKEIQFPIEMSFPWIITEHIVKTKRAMALGNSSSSASSKAAGGVEGSGHGSSGSGSLDSTAKAAGIPGAGDSDGPLTPYGSKNGTKKSKKGKGGAGGGGRGHVLVEEILWALDLYNDAAHRALYMLNSQYLFNEIQAEVNLVFNQLLFDLEAEVFGYFKDWAASTTLDKMFKRVYEARRGWGHFIPGRRRYETPVQQRHVHLLGRSVDLTQRISGAMNRKISEDLELALRRFESGGLGGIVELEGTLEATKKTHLLIKQAGLGVDSFSSLYGEANEVVSPASCKGRVVAHVVRTLVLDLFVNYRYCAATRRMVKSPVELKPMHYPHAPTTIDKNLGGGRLCGKAFEQTYSVGRGFVGSMHLEAMVRVLGYADLPLVVETIIEHMRQKLLDIKDWTDALKGGLPPVKLPKYVFGTAGCYSFMEEKLRPILEYEDLKTGVFQDFRELGNGLAFLQCLSEASAGLDCLKFVHTVPVMGLSSSKKWDPHRTRLVAATSALLRGADFNSEAEASLSGLEGIVLEGQDACKGLATSASIFRHTLAELDSSLDVLRLREAWAGERPSNGVLDVEESTAFSRLFSALNFLFCMPEMAGEARVTDAVQFGDGFGLAGAVIIHLLGQRHDFELLDFSYHVLNVNNFERAGSKDGETGLNVDPAKAKETEAFLHEAHRAFCLIFDAFSVAEAVLPKKSADQAAEVRIFHPPKDDTKINRALLADGGGVWETQDVYGDRQAEAAAKRVRLPSMDKAASVKSSSALSILRRSNKDKTYVPSEADRIEEENRKKKLNTFTYALGAFIAGGEDEQKPAPNLPAPISNDLLAGAGMKSPTQVSAPRHSLATAAAGGGGSAAGAAVEKRAKAPVAAPPPPGAAVAPTKGQNAAPRRPPPPSGPPATPGLGTGKPSNPGRPTSLRGMPTGADQAQRAKSMSPASGALDGFAGTVAVGSKQLHTKESRSASIDGAVVDKGAILPPGAEKMMDMGFSERKARAALQRSGGDAGQAVEWLLANPSSPGGMSSNDDSRPPSPSTVSPPARKSLARKKTLKPQNPVFDLEAFTPVLVPAKSGAIVVSPQPWTPPGGEGVNNGADAIIPYGHPAGRGPSGSGSGPGHGQAQAATLARPRSTPDVISALDPDSIDTIEIKAAPQPQHGIPQPQLQQQQQQQGSQPGSPVLSAVVPGALGVGAAPSYRRQSAPMSLPQGPGSPPLRAMSPQIDPKPLHAQPQQLTQQPRPSNPGLNSNPSIRRPPPPSGPAAVGGNTARGPARTPVPSGRAAVGGNVGNAARGALPRGSGPMLGGAPRSAQSQALVPSGSNQGQAGPQFQQGQGTMQQARGAMQQLVRPAMQGGMPTPVGMSLEGGAGVQSGQLHRPQQTGFSGAGSGGIPQLTPMKSGVQGGMLPFSQQQQQQFAGKNLGLGMNQGAQQPMGQARMHPGPHNVQVLQPGRSQQQSQQQQQPRQIPTLQPTGGHQQQGRPHMQQQGRPQTQQQGRPQMQQQGRPQVQQQGRPQMQQQQQQGVQQGRPQTQQHGRPQMQQQGRPHMQQQERPQMQQQGRPQMQQQGRPQMQQQGRPQMQQQGRPQMQQQQGMQQGMPQMQQQGRPHLQQQGRPQMQQQGMQGGMQPNGRQMSAGQPSHMQAQQQGQPRPFTGNNMGFDSMQQQGQNVATGRGQPTGGMTPHQQQLWQQQQQRERQQQQQQRQQFNPRG